MGVFIGCEFSERKSFIWTMNSRFAMVSKGGNIYKCRLKFLSFFTTDNFGKLLFIHKKISLMQ